ncbi:regulator of chromosome condensation 1/beta-lactamase-inhibitor protein II [Syncephalis fuscata]|nr:regulator of chromosome condensation 1/beta-lactamase-inhibitor protein II [Syncephalis fuscata]
MTLFAFGSNGNGQLGLGHQEDCYKPTACPLSVGAIVSVKGGVWATGAHQAGQLGNKESKVTTIFAPLAGHNSLPVSVKRVACGWEHSLVVSDEQVVWACGSNSHGQCGLSIDRVSSTTLPHSIDYVVREKENGNKDESKEESNRAICISAGLRSSCAVTDQGQLYVWGCNRSGQLGYPKSIKQIVKASRLLSLAQQELQDVQYVSCGQRHTAIVAAAGRSIGCIGDNRWCQLGLMTTTADDNSVGQLMLLEDILPSFEPTVIIREIGTGWSHTVVRLSDGRVLAWGRGDRGQLGVRLPEGIRGSATPIIVDLPATAVSIAVGSEHTLALLEDGQCYTWGWNEHGNCGLGHTNDVYTPTAIPWPISLGAIQGIGAGYGTSFIWT